jgi:hypothetical protein
MRARTPIPTSRGPSYASSADEGFSQAGIHAAARIGKDLALKSREHVLGNG